MANRGQRRSIRLPEYDYSSAGAYFITLVTWQREMLFGEIVDGDMRQNAIGQIVQEEWLCSEQIRAEVLLDAFVIMPNHVHGIIMLQEVGATGRSPLRTYKLPYPPRGPAKRSLGAFVAGFKSAATKKINIYRDLPAHPVWQRNYYERIIRDEKELQTVRAYIENNPLLWGEDEENPNKQ